MYVACVEVQHVPVNTNEVSLNLSGYYQDWRRGHVGGTNACRGILQAGAGHHSPGSCQRDEPLDAAARVRLQCIGSTASRRGQAWASDAMPRAAPQPAWSAGT